MAQAPLDRGRRQSPLGLALPRGGIKDGIYIYIYIYICIQYIYIYIYVYIYINSIIISTMNRAEELRMARLLGSGYV